MTNSDRPLYRPQTALDLLRLPIIGRILQSRWGRLALQGPMLLIALLLIYDGFTGPQVASRNLATVAPWVHYRGFVILVLLLAGNLFCMACPFTLTRTLAKRLSLRGRRFPRWLRNKWTAIASLFGLFFLYEWLDLWASPLLTAWVIIAYFVASFVLEAIFTESAFCKYVCPLGTFNFVYSTLSPTQIAIRQPDVCGACQGQECVNGSFATEPMIRVDSIPISDGSIQDREIKRDLSGIAGCGTELFAPQITSNMDCTLCLDCVRACPHDNIGLFVRQPGRELHHTGAWSRRWDLNLLVIALAFMGLTNAFGMVPPVYDLQAWLIETFGFQTEFPVLFIIFLTGNVLLPISVALLMAHLSRMLTGTVRQYSLRQVVAAFAPAFVPLGFGIWFAHYGFHFLIAPLSLIPVVQEFLGMTGQWEQFGGMVNVQIIGLIQAIMLVGGFVWSLWLAQKAALYLYRRQGVFGLVPVALVLLLLMLAAWYLFSLPMEMRGTDFLFD